MSSIPDSTVPSTLTTRQQIARRKMREDMDKVLLRRPTNAQAAYAQQVAKEADWTVAEQPVRQLPFSLTRLITLRQRDLGNALLEETRLLNERYVGCSFRDVEAMLSNDRDVMDLEKRVLAWAIEVAAHINYKQRNRAATDPVRTFDEAFRSYVTRIDTEIIHGRDRLYQLVWSAIPDLFAFKLLDAIFLKPGLCNVVHGTDRAHTGYFHLAESLQKSANQRAIIDTLGLYGVEPMIYVDDVILSPLLALLRKEPPATGVDELRYGYERMMADLIEAVPYLVSSNRVERYVFEIPGSDCVATISFVPANGCARIMFWDDLDGMKRGLPSNFCRGALLVDMEGKMSSWMHPWRTLEAVYGADEGLLLGHWLLSQVHSRIVRDYLKIEHYFLDGTSGNDDTAADGDALDETLVYVAWAKAADAATTAEENGGTDEGIDRQSPGRLPQLRQRHFFKLLERCGVSIEQGKGSEIKLLRAAKRPFRLGNHYGPNPTIPSFLAVNILKRLEISREEWINAVAG